MVEIPEPAPPPSNDGGDESARAEERLLSNKPKVPGLNEARAAYQISVIGMAERLLEGGLDPEGAAG